MLRKLFKRRSEDVLGASLYASLLKQSRQPEFYGPGRVEDSYDGRIGMIALHMAVILWGLRNHGDKGRDVSQAVHDVMVQDFDIALREEGLTDSGVKRRIKPMANLVNTRLREYTEAFHEGDDLAPLIAKKLRITKDGAVFTKNLAKYVSANATRYETANWLEIVDITVNWHPLTDFT